MDQELANAAADAACAFTRWQHFSAQNDLMAAILKVWRQAPKIRLHQLMHIYLKNNTAKFHPNPIWNERA